MRYFLVNSRIGPIGGPRGDGEDLRRFNLFGHGPSRQELIRLVHADAWQDSHIGEMAIYNSTVITYGKGLFWPVDANRSDAGTGRYRLAMERVTFIGPKENGGGNPIWTANDWVAPWAQPTWGRIGDVVFAMADSTLAVRDLWWQGGVWEDETGAPLDYQRTLHSPSTFVHAGRSGGTGLLHYRDVRSDDWVDYAPVEAVGAGYRSPWDRHIVAGTER